MMTKTDYLIKILEKLRGIWPAAEGFLVVLRAGGFDDSVIDTLVNLLETSLSQTKDEVEKKKLQGSIEVLEKVKLLEKDSLEKDAEECENLLELLNNV